MHWVGVVAAALHAMGALAVLGVSFGCRVERYTDWGYKSAFLGNTTRAYREMASEFWADDEPVPRHGWCPYGLVLAFEWISAAFALAYLGQRGGPLLWLACGLAAHLWLYFAKGVGNWCEPVVVGVSFLLAGAVLARFEQARDDFLLEVRVGLASSTSRRFRTHRLHGYLWRVPLGEDEAENMGSMDEAGRRLGVRLNIMLRYLEYCITAPLLYMAVLSIFVVGPPAWAFLGGYVGVFACNALGLALHLVHVEVCEGPEGLRPAERPEQPSGQALALLWSRRTTVPALGAPPRRPVHAGHAVAAFFGVGAWREHWVAQMTYLEASWFGLLVGMMFVLYLGRPYLFNTALPTVVLLSLWNLLVTYCLFGVAGTVFYARDSLWPWMDTVYDVLSLTAKFPIAVAVCLAFLSMPGGGCK
jgi:hypothetical protein